MSVTGAVLLDGGIDVNPTGELALLRYAFAGLIDASLALGRDAELRQRWNNTLCHLAPWNVGERGGKEVFLGAPLCMPFPVMQLTN